MKPKDLISHTFNSLITEFSNLSKFRTCINELEDSTEKEINYSLSTFDAKQLEEFIELVRHRKGQIDVSPAYGNEVVSISKQILSFGAAGLAFVAAFARDISSLPEEFVLPISFIGLLYFNLVLLSLFIIFLFLYQSRFRYPFLYLKSMGNAIPYFYYRAMSANIPYWFFQTKDNKMKAIEIYLNDLKKFTKYTVESVGDAQNEESENNLNALKRQAKDELQQYFLLISYQGYVNQYEVRINNYFIYGIVGSVASLIILGIIVGILRIII